MEGYSNLSVCVCVCVCLLPVNLKDYFVSREVNHSNQNNV